MYTKILGQRPPKSSETSQPEHRLQIPPIQNLVTKTLIVQGPHALRDPQVCYIQTPRNRHSDISETIHPEQISPITSNLDLTIEIIQVFKISDPELKPRIHSTQTLGQTSSTISEASHP